MLLLIRKRAGDKEIKKAAEDFDGYIKLVVDVKKEILTAGGERHVEGEQILLENGSKQENLWGGGLDLNSKETDYNSMINIRPSQENLSRDIMSPQIRKEFDKIVKKLLL